MRSLPATAAPRFGVFSHAEALDTGWTTDALARAVRSGRLNRLRPGVFCTPATDLPDPFAAARELLARRAIAAALANPEAAISNGGAAVLHDIPRWRPTQTPCVTVLPRFVGDIAGTHLHRARMPAGHVTTIHGVRVTTIARTIIDLGREEGMLSAVVTADAALHLQRVDRQTLYDRVRECAGWPGVRAARRAIDFADGLSESPLESASRVKLAGLVPQPRLQAPIVDENGRFVARTDFLWEALGVVGEADGLDKYDDAARTSLRDEKIRHENLERLGLVVVRWTSADLANVLALVRRLNEAFARAQRDAGPRRWAALAPS